MIRAVDICSGFVGIIFINLRNGSSAEPKEWKYCVCAIQKYVCNFNGTNNTDSIPKTVKSPLSGGRLLFSHVEIWNFLFAIVPPNNRRNDDSNIRKNLLPETKQEEIIDRVLGPHLNFQHLRDRIKKLWAYHFKTELKANENTTGTGAVNANSDENAITKCQFLLSLTFLKDSLIESEKYQQCNQSDESYILCEEPRESYESLEFYKCMLPFTSGYAKKWESPPQGDGKLRSHPKKHWSSEKLKKSSGQGSLSSQMFKMAGEVLKASQNDTCTMPLTEHHFGVGVARDLEEMTEYARDFAKAQIQGILFTAKYDNQSTKGSDVEGNNCKLFSPTVLTLILAFAVASFGFGLCFGIVGTLLYSVRKRNQLAPMENSTRSCEPQELKIPGASATVMYLPLKETPLKPEFQAFNKLKQKMLATLEVNDILPAFRASAVGVFWEGDYERIEKGTTREQRFTTFASILERKDNEWFDVFVAALKNAEYSQLAKDLEANVPRLHTLRT